MALDPLVVALNNARSELQFFRVALQVFYLNIAGRTESPLATLDQMKQDVLKVLDKLAVEPETASGDQRMKAMTQGHAESFFAHLEQHLKTQLEKADRHTAN